MSRELDIEVAEKVMGEVPCDKWNYINLSSGGGPAMMNEGCQHNGKCYPRIEGPCKYSDNISAAMEVVEKLESLGFDIAMWRRYGSTFWEVEFNSGKTNGEADARTLPEAICRAALASITTEKE